MNIMELSKPVWVCTRCRTVVVSESPKMLNVQGVKILVDSGGQKINYCECSQCDFLTDELPESWLKVYFVADLVLPDEVNYEKGE